MQFILKQSCLICPLILMKCCQNSKDTLFMWLYLCYPIVKQCYPILLIFSWDELLIDFFVYNSRHWLSLKFHIKLDNTSKIKSYKESECYLPFPMERETFTVMFSKMFTSFFTCLFTDKISYKSNGWNQGIPMIMLT